MDEADLVSGLDELYRYQDMAWGNYSEGGLNPSRGKVFSDRRGKGKATDEN
jgi:hypothetical protein